MFKTTDHGSSWGQTGPVAHEVRVLAVNSSGHVFAGTYLGGIFRSTTSGESWDSVNTGLTDRRVESLAINSSNGDLFAAIWGAGVFRSTNNGGIWTQTSLLHRPVNILAVNSSGYVFAALPSLSGSGMSRSTDHGNSWTALSVGNTRYVNALAINSSGRIFVGADYGVFRSTDNGDLWSQITSGLPDTAVTRLPSVPMGSSSPGLPKESSEQRSRRPRSANLPATFHWSMHSSKTTPIRSILLP